MILKAIIHKITMLKAVHKYIRIYLYTSIKPANFKVCVQKIRACRVVAEGVDGLIWAICG